MRYIVLSSIFIILALGEVRCHSDMQPNIDNFNKLMRLQNPTIEDVADMIHLSISYSYLNKDSCLQLGEESLTAALETGDRALYAEALIELGDSYRIFDDLDKAKQLLENGREIYLELDDAQHVAQADNKLGALWENYGDYQKALEYYMNALKTWEMLKDTHRIIKPYINIAAVFDNTSRPLLALEYNKKAYEIAELINDDRGKSYVTNNVAVIYSARANKFKAIADTASVNEVLYKDSMNMAIELSLSNFNEALTLARKIKDEMGELRVLGNMADLKLLQGKFEEALELNLGNEQRIAQMGSTKLGIRQKIKQCRIYRAMGKMQKAIEYGEAAVLDATKMHLDIELEVALYELFLSYKENGDIKKALVTVEQYMDYDKRSDDIESKKAISEIESRYESVKKEKKILEQNNDILSLEEKQAELKGRQNNLLIGGISFALLIFFGFLAYSLRRQRNEKMAFAEALIFAQEEERKRIARDLHDGVGQSLLLIKKQLSDTQKSTFDNQALITDTLEEVRSISRDLHPFQLDKLGLTAAIEDVLLRVGENSDLFVSSEVVNIDDLMDKKSELHLYRVIQEALNNVIKHAEASAVKLSISKINNEIFIEIMDNGKGFSTDFKTARTKSLGLRTMYERITSLGGELSMVEVKPRGSNIQITVPIKK
ncbi:MAG: signal transduction histidine kinase [Arenicella sp.]|jgi:signal transduction histidine kinase